MGTFSEDLARRDDAALLALLLARPDLTHPAPTTLRALATHLTAHASVVQALMRLDAAALQVLESVSVLASLEAGPGHGRGPSTADVAHAITGSTRSTAATRDDRDTVTSTLGLLHERALVWRDGASRGGWRTAPGVDDALGAYPAGLGPNLRTAAPGEAGTFPTRGPVDLDDAPAGARELLAALTWEQPVGRVRTDGRHRAAVAWLVARGLLAVVDAEHVVVPRRAGLALRGGRTHRGLTRPPEPAGREAVQADVDAEAATAALETLRQVSTLLRTWSAAPAAVLRAGGLPVRELRRTALAIETDDATAASVVELAAQTGLVVDDGDDPASFVPVDLEEWTATPPGERWSQLVRAWTGSPRTPWAVGLRDERGTARAALAPDVERPWVAPLRRRVLEVLAHAAGTGLDAEQVHEVLAWSSPRAVPPLSAVTALLGEAQQWGVAALGALSSAGRALLAGTARDVAAALDTMLPTAVDVVLLQGDLTGVVPGRPSAALESLLELASDVESRGAGLTVRFTPASVTRALDSGMSGTALRDALATFSPAPVPQPLEYLIDDAARRHGTVRVGAALSYVRVADPAVAAALVAHRTLAPTGAFLLAPTVVAAQVPAAALVEAIRAAGVSPVLEAPDGTLLTASTDADTLRSVRPGARRAHAAALERRRAAARPDRLPGGPVALAEAEEERAAQVVRRLRSNAAARAAEAGSGDDRVHATAVPAAPSTSTPTIPGPRAAPAGTPDPVGALGVLREAAADGSSVRIEVVGARGLPESRDVQPLRVAGGRIRVRDLARDSELTVAVHRLLSATPLTGGTRTDDPSDSDRSSTDPTTRGAR